jgi:hypothetical protein
MVAGVDKTPPGQANKPPNANGGPNGAGSPSPSGGVVSDGGGTTSILSSGETEKKATAAAPGAPKLDGAVAVAIASDPVVTDGRGEAAIAVLKDLDRGLRERQARLVEKHQADRVEAERREHRKAAEERDVASAEADPFARKDDPLAPAKDDPFSPVRTQSAAYAAGLRLGQDLPGSTLDATS